MRHGRAAMVYSILNPGIRHWFDESSDGVVGFVRNGGWWVVAGDPVCEPADLPGVIDRLEKAAAAEGRKVIYCVNTAAMRDAALRAGRHCGVLLGAEPVWRPAGWAGRVQRIPSLRAQLNRARNKGVTILPLPVAEVPTIRGELTGVIDDWLAHRPLPPLRFLIEPMAIDGVLTDRQIYVARKDGQPVAFLLASPVPRRGGWLVEQICRRHDAPNGTSELLIDAAMRRWTTERCTYATLGLVTLTSLSGPPVCADPWWVRLAFAFARVHGRRFYNFDGLEHFRVKMRPDAWEPIYLVGPGRSMPFSALYHAGSAFCGLRSPESVLAEGAMRALKIDSRRLAKWLRRRSMR